MNINDLKLRDRVKVNFTDGVPRYGIIFDFRDYYYYNPDNVLVLFDGEAWSRAIPKAAILAKVEVTMSYQEIPIMRKQPLVFNFTPTSSSHTLDCSSGRFEASMGGESVFFADGKPRFEKDLRLPFSACLGTLQLGKQYKVTIEEIP